MQTVSQPSAPVNEAKHNLALVAVILGVLALAGFVITTKRNGDKARQYVIDQKSAYADYIAWNQWRVPSQQAYAKFSPLYDEFMKIDPTQPGASAQLKAAYIRLHRAESLFAATPKPIVSPGTVAKSREKNLVTTIDEYYVGAVSITSLSDFERASVRQHIENDRNREWENNHVPMKITPEMRLAEGRAIKTSVEKLGDAQLIRYRNSQLPRAQMARTRQLLASALSEPEAVPQELDLKSAEALYGSQKP